MLGAVGALVRGLEAIWIFLFRRRAPVSGDPAERLRRKLAEAREHGEEPEPAERNSASPYAKEAPEPEPPPAADDLESAAEDLESLRRNVHARARALTEEIRGASEDE